MTKKYVCVLDTETAPIAGCPSDGSAHPELSRVYDLGYTLVPKHGDSHDAIVSRSLLITDTFADQRLMDSAYYADKLPQYRQGARWDGSGEWEPMSFLAAYTTFANDLKEHGVSEIWAYNARFDRCALNTTITAYSHGYRRYFAPYGVQWYDLWCAAQAITGTKSYVTWAYEHGRTTPAGNPQTSVEALTGYVTGDPEFAERHTALDDARHEAAILERLYRYSHRGNPRSLGNGWRAAARTARELGLR